MLKSGSVPRKVNMLFKRYPIIVLSLILAASSIMCSIFFSSYLVEPGEKDKQATMNSLRTTIAAIEMEAITDTPEPVKLVTFATMVRPQAGSISGRLSYPSESLPPMRIVAVNILTGEQFATEEYEGGLYGIQGLPAGTYHVFAYPVDTKDATKDLAAGFTEFVTCGLTAECQDHSLIDVVVAANTVTSDVNPGDWYAPPGSFPPDPFRQ